MWARRRTHTDKIFFEQTDFLLLVPNDAYWSHAHWHQTITPDNALTSGLHICKRNRCISFKNKAGEKKKNPWWLNEINMKASEKHNSRVILHNHSNTYRLLQKKVAWSSHVRPASHPHRFQKRGISGAAVHLSAPVAHTPRREKKTQLHSFSGIQSQLDFCVVSYWFPCKHSYYLSSYSLFVYIFLR